MVKALSLIILVVFVALATFYFREHINPGELQQFIRGFGWIGPIIFIGIYALAAVSFLPGSILTITGGVLFGPLWGTLYNITGAVLGATLAFIISRFIARDWVTSRLGARLNMLMNGIAKEGWRFVALLRLMPLVPFNLLNYALGVTNIRLWHYVLASAVFMLPGCFAYTYLGHAGLALASGAEGWARTGLLALTMVAAIVFLPRLIKRLK